MTRDDLQEIVHKALGRTVERATGQSKKLILTGKTVPIGDLGLDSMSGVGFSCDLEDFGIELGDEHNPFVDDKKRHARNIDEIVQFIEANALVAGAA